MSEGGARIANEEMRARALLDAIEHVEKRLLGLEPLLRVASICNEPIAAWRGPHVGRCNKPRGHAGECGRVEWSQGSTNLSQTAQRS